MLIKVLFYMKLWGKHIFIILLKRYLSKLKCGYRLVRSIMETWGKSSTENDKDALAMLVENYTGS